MGDVKWIKVMTDIFDNNKIVLINRMEKSDLIINVWFRLLCQAGKANSDGDIFLCEDMPYTCDMLSALFGKSEEDINMALKVLQNFKMITVDDDNYIHIINWEKYQNIKGMEKIREQGRKRVEKLRRKKKAKEEGAADGEEREGKGAVKVMADGEERYVKGAVKVMADGEEREVNGAVKVITDGEEREVNGEVKPISDGEEREVKGAVEAIADGEGVRNVVQEGVDNEGVEASSGIREYAEDEEGEACNAVKKGMNYEVGDVCSGIKEGLDNENGDVCSGANECVDNEKEAENYEVKTTIVSCENKDGINAMGTTCLESDSLLNYENDSCDNSHEISKERSNLDCNTDNDDKNNNLSTGKGKINSVVGTTEFTASKKCNADVTQQKKRENKKEEKKKNKDKSESNRLENANRKAAEIIKYYEVLTGRMNGLNLGTLSLCILDHGEEHVKMAIEKAIEVNKADMRYINGILRNWRIEGYPQNEGSVGIAGDRRKCASKNTKKFTGIKKQSTARLSDEELKKLEAELI